MSASKKIVVIGGTGLIGSKVVAILQQAGHEAVIASPQYGINAYTGEGLDSALAGSDAVVDVSNMMSFDGPVIRDFFETSSRNLTAAEQRAGVLHHVVLSIVGTDSLASNPYLSGKLAQETAVKASKQAYTIVRATQFYQFIGTLVDAYTVGDAVVVPDTEFQPVDAEDVAANLVSVVLGEPRNSTFELAGPDRASFEFVLSRYLQAKGDSRKVTVDASLGYLGAPVNQTSLVPTGESLRGQITLADYLRDLV